MIKDNPCQRCFFSVLILCVMAVCRSTIGGDPFLFLFFFWVLWAPYVYVKKFFFHTLSVYNSR